MFAFEAMNVWAQMFFEDGSVTQGIRVPADVFDDEMGELRQIAVKLLDGVRRQEGLLLVWGAGEIFSRYYDLTSPSSEELSSLAEQPSSDESHQSKMPESPPSSQASD